MMPSERGRWMAIDWGERRIGLATICGGRHHRQRAPSDPETTAFVADGRTPAAHTPELPRGAAPERDRPRARDEDDAGVVAESIRERDLSIRDHQHLIGE